MAIGGFLGDENKAAQSIASGYIGDEKGIAQKIVKAYIGDENGIAQLCYSGDVCVTLTGLSANAYCVTGDGKTYQSDATLMLPIGTRIMVRFVRDIDRSRGVKLNGSETMQVSGYTTADSIHGFCYVVTGDVSITATSETSSDIVTIDESNPKSGCFTMKTNYPSGAYNYKGYSYRKGMTWGEFLDSVYNTREFKQLTDGYIMCYPVSGLKMTFDDSDEADTVALSEKIIDQHQYVAAT